MKSPPPLRKPQCGLAVVEFSIVASAALLMIFGVIEIARAMFVANALTEATRRGARVAAVCPINDPAIAQVATFNAPGAGDNSPIIRDLDTTDFVLEYLDADGAVIGNPADNFGDIDYVQLRVVGFEHELLIPFVNSIFTMPQFSTRLPRESLGVPRDGAITAC